MEVSKMGFEQGQFKQKNNNRTNQHSSNTRNNTGFNNKPYMVVPYVKDMSERWKNICWKHGIEMHFKGGSMIKDLMVHPKDRDTIFQKSGVIYRYKCGMVGCENE